MVTGFGFWRLIRTKSMSLPIKWRFYSAPFPSFLCHSWLWTWDCFCPIYHLYVLWINYKPCFGLWNQFFGHYILDIEFGNNKISSHDGMRMNVLSADPRPAHYGVCEPGYRETCHPHWRVASYKCHSGYNWEGTLRPFYSLIVDEERQSVVVSRHTHCYLVLYFLKDSGSYWFPGVDSRTLHS